MRKKTIIRGIRGYQFSKKREKKKPKILHHHNLHKNEKVGILYKIYVSHFNTPFKVKLTQDVMLKIYRDIAGLTGSFTHKSFSKETKRRRRLLVE